MRPPIHPFLLATLIAIPGIRALDAQTRTPQLPGTVRDGEVRIERLPQGVSVFVSGANRAVLGVTLASDSRADTNGVRISDVRADSPAAKAGLKAGDIITEISGVSLKLSAADAADPEMAGLGQRRLQRTLGKATPGDEIDLRVQSGSTSRSVKVKTVSQSELDGDRARVAGQPRFMRENDRPAIGISVGTSNNIRDTLGLFVSSVVAKGPAENAGVVEGERIAAVNGVDVRVPREDVEDANSGEARVNRFVREVQKGEAGATLTLRVYGGGRFRDVAVKTVKSSTLPSTGFRFNIGDGQMRMFTPEQGMMTSPRTPSRPLPPGSPDEPRIRIRERSSNAPRAFEFDGMNGQIHIDGAAIEIGRESVQRAMEEVRRRMQEMGRDLQFQFRGEVDATAAPGVLLRPRRTITIL